MNNIVSYNNRRYGFAPWTNYDSILSRLCVKEADSWRGIAPSTQGAAYNPEPPIFAAKFATADGFQNMLAIANEDGMVALHNTEVGAMQDVPPGQPLNGTQCHVNAIFDLEWMPYNMKLVSASGDHDACLWDVTESGLINVRTFKGHIRSVRTAAFRHEDPAVFATGSRDGSIFVWDIRASSTNSLHPKPDNSIPKCHGFIRSKGVSTPSSNSKKKTRHTPNQSSPSCYAITGLIFQDEYNIISCGDGDGVIKVWDFRKNYSISKREPVAKHILPYAGTSGCNKGFTNLIVDKNRTKLYANCTDGNIYCYNVSSYSAQPIQTYVSSIDKITYYIKSSLSADGQYLVSGSNEKAYIWNINYSKPLLSLEGHSAEVTCAVWCPKNEVKIVTCTDDARHKIWRIGSEFVEENEKSELRGQAELMEGYKESIININKKLKLNEALETTPRSEKRWTQRNECTPSSANKLNTVCEKCKTISPFSYNSNACDRCQKGAASGSRSSKRSLSQMLDSLSSAEETEANEPKRIHLENKGARRLFSPQSKFSSTTRWQTNSNEDTNLATILEEVDDCNTSILDSSRVIHKTISPEPTTQNDHSNQNVNGVCPNTPHSVRITNFSSPTINLPNFVLDGEAPHLRTISPKKKMKENIDWLTKMRKEKALKTEYQNLTNPVYTSPKIIQNNVERSPDTHKTPGRRVKRSRSSTEQIQRTPVSRRNNPDGTLLRFFTFSRQQNQCS